MRPAVLSLVLILALPVTWADERESAPKPLAPEQAAAMVLKALAAGDQDALGSLARTDDPDPWIVADELCRRVAFDAAEAFARAAPRPAISKLPDYVRSRRGEGRETAAREALAAMDRAMRAGAFDKALEVGATVSGPLDTVVRLRIACSRGVSPAREVASESGETSWRGAF